MHSKKIVPILTTALFGIALSGCTLPPLYNSEISSSGTSTSEDSSEYTSEEISSMIEGATSLVFSSTSTVEISNSNGKVTSSGSYVYISGAGDYVLSGSATNMQIQVNAVKASVNLILNGVSLGNTKNAPIYVVNAEETDIIVAPGTINTLSDATTYTYENTTEQDPKATIFSKDDLNIQGTGTLNVTANFNNGIFSSNDLRFKATEGIGPTITINAKNDAIKGKDSVQIENGTYNLTSGGDAIQSDTADTLEKGYIYIKGGTFDVHAVDDGFQGYRYVQIDEGNFTMTTTGKGLISDLDITVNGGTFGITSVDDAIHSTGNATITGGNFTVSTNDDGYHAETTLTISGGTHLITKSYEGYEATTININGGTSHITSSDDGLNAAGGDGSTTWGGSSSTGTININDGYLYVNATGDGLDSNGSIFITGGTTLVNGPTSNGNGPLDCGDQSGYISQTGGTLVAVGSSGMAVGVTQGNQYSAIVRHTAAVATTSQYVVLDSANNPVMSFKPVKNSYSIAVSSSLFTSGGYKLYSGGTLTNPTSTSDGYSLGGTYSGGTQITSWSFSSSLIHYSFGSTSGPGGR